MQRQKDLSFKKTWAKVVTLSIKRVKVGEIVEDFVFMYEYGILKTVKVISKRRVGEEGE
jgi:hypothetical protein